jgi:hypothetical protein
LTGFKTGPILGFCEYCNAIRVSVKRLIFLTPSLETVNFSREALHYELDIECLVDAVSGKEISLRAFTEVNMHCL